MQCLPDLVNIGEHLMADQVPADDHEGAGKMAVVLAHQEPGVSVRCHCGAGMGRGAAGGKAFIISMFP